MIDLRNAGRFFVAGRRVARKAALVSLVALAGILPARAFTINVTYDASVTRQTNAAQIKAAFGVATQTIQNYFTNNSTANITVYWGQTDTNGPFPFPIDLGESYTSLIGTYFYAEITDGLRTNATSAADYSSVASLPASDPIAGDQWYIPQAEAKAIGLSTVYQLDPNDTSQDDGDVAFATNVSYTFDATNRAVSGKIDFIGVAEHELTEALGRSSGLNIDNDGFYIPYDLFRFTAPGTRSFLVSTNIGTVYFSVNDGTSVENYFYTNVNLGDVQDWRGSSPEDSFDAFVNSGHQLVLSGSDITAMDILGYNMAIPHLTGSRLVNGNYQLNFTSSSNLSFTVLASPNAALSGTNWTVLGAATNTSGGQYQFTDTQTAGNQRRFYRVRTP